MFKNIHQTVTFNATPQAIYEALLDSEKHSAFTDAPARVSDKVGEAFTCYGDYIQGMNVELVPGERIVQAWRGANWAEGVYSMVTYRFEATEGGTRLDFHHVGVPEEAHEGINQGWKDRYWSRIEAWLAQG